MLRIGLIGAGVMGITHSDAYHQVAGARITAVCSRTREKAQPIMDGWGAAYYASVDEMLNAADIDAVDICLPTDLHREAVVKSAAKGKHVLCEKPIAATEADAEAMIRACRQAGVTFMVGHVNRFNPEWGMARSQLLAGRLGTPGTVRTARNGSMPGWSTWFHDYGETGTLLDMAIHDFDYLRWCFGPVRRVFSRSAGSGAASHSLTMLRFASGVIGHVEASWAYPAGTPLMVTLEIAGSGGVLSLDRNQSHPLVVFGGNTESPPIANIPLKKNQFVRQLEHFVHCANCGATPLTSGEEALAALRISLAAIESVRSGKAIVLEEEAG